VRLLSWLSGATILLACMVAPAALLARKGSRIHRAFGRVYFLLISLSASLAVGLVFMRGNPFVAGVSILSLQAALSGIRSVQLKFLREGQRVSPWSWQTTFLFLTVDSGMAVVGLRETFEGGSSGDTALVVVGAVGLVLAIADLAKFRKPPRAPWHWFSTHIGAMLASYAAALSAFSAIYLTMLPPGWRLLWPALVVAPLLMGVVAVYERLFAEGVQPRDVAEVTAELPVVPARSDDAGPNP
jgi:uncharacterized membrane protein